eukprot:CAMPEP_0183735836 /NCGR_PEP_ID=MMETSP0737-20130205/47727_1 /TAXON_ID=385413 /ORGANISM="Thalassiosira miniscula, Strain CCMP1093" /LENGTH=767 /DNA_ID=CAMNT_0025969687 /DNA_START=103 /DNA_END=2406 /DNA_ORIENTATION=+
MASDHGYTISTRSNKVQRSSNNPSSRQRCLIRALAFAAILSYGIFLVSSPRQVKRLLDAAFDNDVAAMEGDDSHHGSSRSETELVRERLLQAFNSLLRDKQTQLYEDGNTDSSNGEPKNNNENNDDGGLCSILPKPTPTTLTLWSHHLPHVFNASQHPADHNPEFVFHDFTALLLHFMTPDRLQRSVKSLPLDWTPVERSLDILYRRLKSIRVEVDAYRKKKYLRMNEPIPEKVMQTINANPNHPRKLHVVVMGGSVTMGVLCHFNPSTSQTARYSRRACAWPGRLTPFFTTLFGGIELLEFHTLALGGTNTESGITMWDYSLIPDGVPYPDIVINGYATNDMHVNSVAQAAAKNVTLEQSLLELSQEFVRQLLTPKRACSERPPPLLLYLDDYLGNEQNEIMKTLLSSQTINMIAGYYGIGAISYGDAVRDLVHGDAKEWWFSSNWYEGGKYQRAVHPHMGMHISMVWVVAFNLLNLVTTYCSLPKLDEQSTLSKNQIHNRRHAGVIGNESQGVWDYGYQPVGGLPNLQATKELVGGPKAKPRGIPPSLTEDLSLEHVTQLWNKDAESNSHLWRTLKECIEQGHVYKDDNMSESELLPKPCIYSWVSNLERRLDNPKRLTDKLKPYITYNQGWSAADDNNKLGWVPSSGVGSKFTMEWKKLTQPVRAVTWMIMRSYGEKWEGSTVKVEVWSDGTTLLASESIVGFHDKKTSETYNIKMRLGSVSGDDSDKQQKREEGAVVGSDLKITFELVGGTTFKISGMAICDH